MGLELTLLLSDLFLPILMIGCGLYFTRMKAKQAESAGICYRTERSMKNRMTFKYAHKKLGKFWMRSGWMMLVVTLSLFLNFMRIGLSDLLLSYISALMMILQVLPMMLGILRTENALKHVFDDEGNLRVKK